MLLSPVRLAIDRTMTSESNTSCGMLPRIGTEEPTLVVVAICCLGTGAYLISGAGRRREPPRRWYLNEFEDTIQVNARSSCRLPALQVGIIERARFVGDFFANGVNTNR
jgi:hypothetical protein